MNVTDAQNYWQSYTQDILNGNKDRDATLSGYEDALAEIETLQTTPDGPLMVSDETRAFLESEGIFLPSYDESLDLLNPEELTDLQATVTGQHEQVSVSNSIVKGFEDQVLRNITSTLAERRNMFENEEEFI